MNFENPEIFFAIDIIKRSRFSHYLIWNEGTLEIKCLELFYDATHQIIEDLDKIQHPFTHGIRKGFRKNCKSNNDKKADKLREIMNFVGEHKENPYLSNRSEGK